MSQPESDPEPPIPFPGTVAAPVAAERELDPLVDARLLAELAAGHSGALAELYRRRGGALLRLLERILVIRAKPRKSCRTPSCSCGNGPAATMRRSPVR